MPEQELDLLQFSSRAVALGPTPDCASLISNRVCYGKMPSSGSAVLRQLPSPILECYGYPMRLIPRYQSVCLIVTVAGFCPRAAAEPPGAIGIVNRVKGPWVRPQDQRQLVRGDIIFQSQTISVEHSISSSISIILFATGTKWEKLCTVQDPCEGSYRPPSSRGEEMGFWSFLKSYWHFETKVPPIFAGSRSLEDAGPNHALLTPSRGAVDLAPVLANVRAGKYTVVLTPQNASRDLAESKRTLSIEWRPGVAVMVDAPQPGLYSIEVFAGGPVGHAAAVLIPGENAAHAQEVWREVQNRTKHWTAADSAALDDLLLETLCALQPE